jgi:hypothetical protein
MLQVFSNLLIFICLSVGSNPTLSATQSPQKAGYRRTSVFLAQIAAISIGSSRLRVASMPCLH